jgi:nucleoside-diphosphate-sugar epimerase
MKIVITGSSGYVGSALVGYLSTSPTNQIIGIDRRRPLTLMSNNFQYLEIDLAEKNINWDLMDLCDVDAVVHLAAARGDWNLTLDDYFRDNLSVTNNLLAAPWAKEVNKWILMSSVSVYGPSNFPIDESSSCNPIGPYGESKLASENVFIEFAQRYKKKFCVIRPSAIFSADHPPDTNVYKLIESLRSFPVPIIGAGMNKKSLTYLPNLIQLTEWLLDRMKNGNLNEAIYNYVEEPTHTVAELIDMLRDSGIKPSRTIKIPLWIALFAAWPIFVLSRIIGVDLRITPERVKKYISSTWYDASLVRQHGFYPKYSFVDALNSVSKSHMAIGKKNVCL